MSFSIGDNTVINDSTIDPGKDKDGESKDLRIGDNTVINDSTIGNGAQKK